MSWLTEVFSAPKPVIAMCHMKPLPGDPSYDSASGMAYLVESTRKEMLALQAGGVDAVMFSNEFSLPYLTETEPITAISMARIIGEISHELSIPFGVNVLWDAQASIDLAVATGASFVREIFTGVYASDFGLWNTNVGRTARRQRAVDGQAVRLLYNIVPEAASYLGERSIEQITKSTVFNCKPDGLCVSGLTAGAATDATVLQRVKDYAGDTPVIVNTGVREDSAYELLSIADAAVVGTYFKRDGVFENEADTTRVERLMAEVTRLRADLAGK
ncbi:BtpA/SgcQ family protein [Pontimonas salivibrio]|nr:BtpA/SgcQ family protein [Pontimonas salivibrio]